MKTKLTNNDVRIFLDMDGVVYDWLGRAFEILGIDDKDPKNREIIKSDYNGWIKLTDRDIVNKAVSDAGSEFWENLELLPWGKELYNRLSAIAPVCFLTSQGKWPEAAEGKIKAVRRDFDTSKIIVTRHKHYCAHPNAMLIDDKFSGIERFIGSGGMGFHWENQYRIFDDPYQESEIVDLCIEGVDSIRQEICKRNSKYV